MNSDQKTDGKSLVIIGAGPMGLAAAYLAAKKGWSVTLLEADDRVGGMAAHFDFDGMSIERYYHFCCLSDIDTIDLLEDLGLNGAMKWVTTTMGFYVNRELHDWGHPVALLRFPGMNFFEKLRYGVQAFYSTKRSDWERLDTISAKDWFTDWCGPGVYERMWRPLMELKFYEYSDKISAAWMWQRIKRLGNSRKSLFEERLGYIDGGTDTLMKALEAKIQELGGQIHLSCPATEIVADEGKTLTGVRLTNGETVHAENIVSTAPMPVVPRLLEKSLPDLADQYTDFDNIGVVCVMLKLNQSVSRHFWVNISDESVGVPGIVEFSNLRPLEQTVVYVPFYMPVSNDKFGQSDAEFVAESLGAVQLVNPSINADNIVGTHVGRLRYAQPICDVGFAKKIPDPQTPVKGLQIADTCFYYPEDRGVSESIKFAKRMVENLGDAS